MSVQEWIRAEKFYNGYFSTCLMIIGIIVLLAMIFGLYGEKKGKLRQLALVLVSLGLLMSGGVSYYYFRYLPYLNQAAYVTPQMRSHEYKNGAFRPYDPSLMMTYRLSYNMNNLKHLNFYEAKATQEKLEVLGYNDGYYYFKYGQVVCRMPKFRVSLVEDDQVAEVLGQRFVLNRLDYKQLYFFNPAQAFAEDVHVPKRFYSIRPNLDFNAKYYRLEYLMKDKWLFEGFPYTEKSATM